MPDQETARIALMVRQIKNKRGSVQPAIADRPDSVVAASNLAASKSKPGVGPLQRNWSIGKASNGGEPSVDPRLSEILLFQEEPVSRHDGSIEREPRLRTVPPDELIDRVPTGFLRTRRRERIHNSFFECSRPANRRIVFGLCFFAVFCRPAMLAARCAARSVRREKRTRQV